ncbi:uncharacterized protein LOC108667962 [Hyalella azteca]|uniref:Uncharacterized protein LOC108667962 n=1 Tax=Hyalella azteca TaxID=294128 RepID=A0A8B7NAF3_HYAAZ|nr:uncharacterized protein LOC108667962 [Hyalella azteca]
MSAITSRMITLVKSAIVFMTTLFATQALLQQKTFEKFFLGNLTRHTSLCPPVNVTLDTHFVSARHILCLDRCLASSNCTFFSLDGIKCSLWSFGVDASYQTATFAAPTLAAHKPSALMPPVDVALAKLVIPGSVYPGGYDAAVLTMGTSCIRKMEDCFCTSTTKNFAKIDLGAPQPVAKIVLTAPTTDDCPYFTGIRIRAGLLGDATDPVVGTTPTQVPTQSQQFEFPVTTGPVQYVYLWRPATGDAMCLCKVQALV